MRVRGVYEKGDSVRFLGHLDVARCLRLAMVRAQWPLGMSAGFSPKPKISVYSPLPVGVAGLMEYFDATLDEERDLGSLAGSLSRCLPSGFALGSLSLVSEKEESLEERIVASSYTVDMKGPKIHPVGDALERFLAETSVPFSVVRPKETKEVDLRPFVLDIGPWQEEGDSANLEMEIAHHKGRTVRPAWVLSSLVEYGSDFDAREAIITRRKITFEQHSRKTIGVGDRRRRDKGTGRREEGNRRTEKGSGWDKEGGTQKEIPKEKGVSQEEANT